MNEQQPLLQINNLSLAYGAKEILKAVQLTVFPGEILGIVGSSGGGKSTLLKTLTGLLPADAVITNGEILWQGHNLLSGGRLNNRGLLGRKLSMIFQDPTASLYPLQTIGSQICTMLCRHRGSSIRPPACNLPRRCLPGSIFPSRRPF